MSWYSNLVSTTSSRINNLRTTLLGGDADGDTPDDTNVCRVLRGYYTEKGRQFPNWLPPDPKAPPPAAPVFVQPSVGSRYGLAGGAGAASRGGALSSLWDNPAPQRQDPQSLRQGRGLPPPMRGADMQQRGRPNPYAAAAASGYGGGGDDVQARPLPSQRAGSYQNAYGTNSTAPPGVGGGGGSAQDRLRNKLFRGGGSSGARTTSPGNAGPFQPPPPASSGYGGGGGGGGGDGGGTDNYEDRFAPGGMYDAAPSSGYGGGGRAMGGGDGKAFMAANSPWAADETEFSGLGGGGGGGGRSGVRPPGGLPSGPRRGLPSGPRMR